MVGRRRGDSEQLAAMDEDDGLHLCENKTKRYRGLGQSWASSMAVMLGSCWVGFGYSGPGKVSLSLSFSLYKFLFLFTDFYLFFGFKIEFCLFCRFQNI